VPSCIPWTKFSTRDALSWTGFFVSPTILVTCGQSTAESEDLGKPIGYCFTDVQSYVADDAWQAFSHELELLFCGCGCTEHKEVEPEKSLGISACDFAFFESKKFRATSWLHPTNQLPVNGTMSHLIAMNGKLRTMNAYKHIKTVIPNVDALNSEMCFERLSVSFGTVLAQNRTQVAITCSASSGASGAPCISSDCDQFMGIYLGTMRGEDKCYRPDLNNHALLVQHPHFAQLYTKFVSKELIAVGKPLPASTKSYLRTHSQLLDETEKKQLETFLEI